MRWPRKRTRPICRSKSSFKDRPELQGLATAEVQLDDHGERGVYDAGTGRDEYGAGRADGRRRFYEDRLSA